MTAPLRRAARHAAAALALLLLPGGCGGGKLPATPLAIAANPSDVETTLFLIGDAGAPANDEPVLKALVQQARETPGAPVIVYLGDNIYPAGLPDSGAVTRAEAERRLNPQIDVAKKAAAQVYFVPGNHDWGYMTATGWNAIKRQGAYIARRGGGRAALLPSGGCPGPAYVDVGLHLRLVMLDTQWWLHDFDKPTHPSSDCPTDLPQEVLDSLGGLLASAGGRHSVVAGHHPLRTGGPHGGHFGWRPHIFPLRAFASWLWIPLPVLGSYLPLARKQGMSNQDISGPLNRMMRGALGRVFDRHQALVYAAGHEHSLQVFEGESARYLLVSGSGIYGHVSRVAWRDRTRYASSSSGFMRLDIMHDGRVRLGVMTVSRNAEATESFSLWLEQE